MLKIIPFLGAFVIVWCHQLPQMQSVSDNCTMEIMIESPHYTQQSSTIFELYSTSRSFIARLITSKSCSVANVTWTWKSHDVIGEKTADKLKKSRSSYIELTLKELYLVNTCRITIIVEAIVNDKSMTTYKPVTQFEVNLEKNRPVLVITPPEVIYKSFNNDIILNATQSYDKDETLELKDMLFYWYCSKEVTKLNFTRRHAKSLTNVPFGRYVSYLGFDTFYNIPIDSKTNYLISNLESLNESNWSSNYPNASFERCGDLNFTRITDSTSPVIRVEKNTINQGEYVVICHVVNIYERIFPTQLPDECQLLPEEMNVPYCDVQTVRISSIEKIPTVSIQCIYNCWERSTLSGDRFIVKFICKTCNPKDKSILMPYLLDDDDRFVNYSISYENSNFLTFVLWANIPLAVKQNGDIHLVSYFRCEIHPKTGSLFLTTFHINCTWDSPASAPHTRYDRHCYYIEYSQEVDGDELVLHHTGSLEARDLYLVVGNSSKNYSTKVMVKTIDINYADFKTTMDVVVRPTPLSDNLMTTTKNFSTCRHFSGVIQYGYGILLSISSPAKDLKTALQNMQIRKEIIEEIRTIPLLTIATVKQVVTFVKIIFSKPAVEFDLSTLYVAWEIINDCSAKLLNFSRVKYHRSRNKIMEVCKLLFLSVDNLCRTFYRMSQQAYIRHLYDIYESNKGVNSSLENFVDATLDEMNAKGAIFYQKKRDSFLRIKEALLPTSYMGEMYQFEGEVLTLSFTRALYSNLLRSTLPFDEKSTVFRIVLPQSEDEDLIVDLQIIHHSKNFIEGPKSVLKNGMLPIEISLHKAVPNEETSNISGGIQIYHLTAIPFWTANDIMKVRSSENVIEDDIYIYETLLNPSHLKLKQLILVIGLTDKRHSVNFVITFDTRPRVKDVQRGLVGVSRGVFQISVNELNATQTLYIGFLPSNETAKLLFKERSDTASPAYMSFFVSLMAVQCVRYKEREHLWSTEHCTAMKQTDPNETFIRCQCSSLSPVSATVEDIPLFHRTSTEFDPFAMTLTVPTCYLILTIQILILLIIFLLILLAWLLKRRIHQTTGIRYKAGTDAKMIIQINGSDGNSDVHLCVDSRTNFFKTGSANHFLIFTQKPLGSLKGLSFRLQPQDDSTKWFLKDILVYDLISREGWKFTFNSWLLFDRRAHLEKHYLKVTESISKVVRVEEMSFRTLLTMQFKEDYIWFGLSKRIRQYFVPNLMRLSLILLFILTAFFINLFLRGFPSNSPVEHIGEYGFQVLWRDVKYGLIEAAILSFFLPIFYILRCLFSEESLIIFIDLDSNWNPGGAGDGERRIESYDIFSRRKYLEFFIDEVDVVNRCRRRKESYIVSKRSILNVLLERNVSEKRTVPHDSDKDSSQYRKVLTVEHYYELREPRTKNRHIYLVLITIWSISLVLFIFNVVFGSRISHTKAMLWAFSAIVALCVCIFVFHPIIIAFSTLVFPWKGHDTVIRLSNDIPDIIKTRNDRIILLGTLDQYVAYLERLRNKEPYKNLNDPL